MHPQSQNRQSQVINKFFTFVSIVIISIVMMVYAKYGPDPKRINSGLECQQLTTTSDKIFDQELLLKAHSLMQNGAYSLDGGFIKPRFGKSYLNNEINIETANTYFEEAISKQKLDAQRFVTIKYEIIENDKNDPRKQDEACLLHAGSLQSSFRINGKEAFRVHTDFLRYDKDEIKSKIECTIHAFTFNAQQ